jgi:hypothetical protein
MSTHYTPDSDAAISDAQALMAARAVIASLAQLLIEDYPTRSLIRFEITWQQGDAGVLLTAQTDPPWPIEGIEMNGLHALDGGETDE